MLTYNMPTYNLVVLQKSIRHFCDTWKINSFKKKGCACCFSQQNVPDGKVNMNGKREITPIITIKSTTINT